MRIALVSDCYPPRLGGIESQVHALAHRLCDAGWDVDVWTATPAGRQRGESLEDEGGVRVHRLTLRLPFDLPINPFAGRALREGLRVADVVHVHMGVVSPFATRAVELALRLGRATVVTWHCLVGGQAAWYRLVHHVRGWARRGAVLTAVSDVAARQVERVAEPGVRVGTLPNCTSGDLWLPVARERAARGRVRGAGAPPRPGLRAACAMRLAPRKRSLALAGIARRLESRGSPVRIDVYGDGPALPLLRRRCGPLRAHGRVDQRALAAAYLRADVFVSPTIKEAFGIAALEARAAGLPIVGRAGSGLESFLTDGRDAVLVDSDAAMADALDRLSRDPELLGRLQRCAGEQAPEELWESPASIARFEGAYARARALAGSTRTPPSGRSPLTSSTY